MDPIITLCAKLSEIIIGKTINLNIDNGLLSSTQAPNKRLGTGASHYASFWYTNSELRFEGHWRLSVNSLVNFLHLVVLFSAELVDVQVLAIQPLGQKGLRNAVGPGIVCSLQLELLIISEVFNVLHF